MARKHFFPVMLTPQVVIDHQGIGINVSRTELVDADAREGKKEVGDPEFPGILTKLKFGDPV